MQQKWKTEAILYDAEEISKVLFYEKQTSFNDLFETEDDKPFLNESDEQKFSFPCRKPAGESNGRRDYSRFGKIDSISFSSM